MIKVYDLIYDEKPQTLKEALQTYKEALQDESAEELKEQIQSECHYVIEPELTYTSLQMLPETIHLTVNNCKRHLIILNRVIIYLQTYLRILICIPIAWEQATKTE